MSFVARIKSTILINAPIREHLSLLREAKFLDLKPSKGEAASPGSNLSTAGGLRLLVFTLTAPAGALSLGRWMGSPPWLTSSNYL